MDYNFARDADETMSREADSDTTLTSSVIDKSELKAEREQRKLRSLKRELREKLYPQRGPGGRFAKTDPKARKEQLRAEARARGIRDETESFKQIDLVDFAQRRYGYQPVPGQPGEQDQGVARLRRGEQEIIVIERSAGTFEYFDPAHRRNQGTIIDLVVRREGLDLNEQRGLLRAAREGREIEPYEDPEERRREEAEAGHDQELLREISPAGGAEGISVGKECDAHADEAVEQNGARAAKASAAGVHETRDGARHRKKDLGFGD
jgi:hypothetical protein